MSLPCATLLASVLESVAAPGKGFAFGWPLCRSFFLGPAARASRPEVLDIDRPPGAIGRLSTLDSFARAASLGFFGAQG
ncbi:MAG TPA: hypothetical protein VFC11_03500 [Methylocella sp.]|nr:hypothetical protein [Methylocella sp.]